MSLHLIRLVAPMLYFASLVSAQESDPKQILRESAAAISRLRSATYHIETYGTGSLANRVTQVSADITVARRIDGIAVRIQGTYKSHEQKRGSDGKDEHFIAYFKNGNGSFCQEGREAASCGMQNHSSGLMRFKDVICMVFPEIGSLESESKRAPMFRGQKDIDGIPCYVVQASSRDLDCHLWFIAKSDHFPRRMEQVARSREAGALVCEVSKFVLDPQLDDELFERSADAASKAVDSRASEFDRQLDVLRTQIASVKQPARLTVPDWAAEGDLDQVVSSWLRARARAETVSSHEDMDAHVSLTNSAREAKESLWIGPRKQLIASHEPGELRTFTGKLNALHYLAALGMDNALKELIQTSAQAGAFSEDALGHSPLDYAAIYGRAGSIQILCELNKGWPDRALRALCNACVMGNAVAVRAFLDAKAARATGTDASGKTPLEFALEGGNEETVNVVFSALLQETGEDPDSIQPLREFLQPVLTAISNYRVDSLRMLSKHVDLTGALEAKDIGLSAAPESKDKSDRMNLLHYAAGHGNKDVVEFLMKEVHLEAASFDEHGRPPLFFSCSREVVETLLTADPDLIDHIDEFNRCAAHYLAARNSGDALKLVLQRRPKQKNAVDKTGSVPIEFAIEANSAMSLAVLLESGVDPNIRFVDSDSTLGGIVDMVAFTALGKTVGRWFVSKESTLLHVAARLGNQETAKVVLRAGARINEQDACGRSPLVVALVHDQIDFAKWLLQGHIQARQDTGTQPDSAVPAKGDDKSKGQIKSGTASFSNLDVNLAAANGCRPIHLVAHAGNLELLHLLLKAGTDVNAHVSPNVPIVSKADDFFKGCGIGLQTDATPYELARAARHWKVADTLKKAGAITKSPDQ